MQKFFPLTPPLWYFSFKYGSTLYQSQPNFPIDKPVYSIKEVLFLFIDFKVPSDDLSSISSRYVSKYTA